MISSSCSWAGIDRYYFVGRRVIKLSRAVFRTIFDVDIPIWLLVVVVDWKTIFARGKDRFPVNGMFSFKTS